MRNTLKKLMHAAAAFGAIAMTFLIWGGVNSIFRNSTGERNDSSPIAGTIASFNGRNLILGNAKATDGKQKDDNNVLLKDPTIMSALWGLQKTDAREAWSITQGSKDVVVAIIDTGADLNHPNLSDNFWTNPGESGFDAKGKDRSNNGIDDDGNGYIDDVHGWNFVSNNNDLSDNHGHGTHIAGIIGGHPTPGEATPFSGVAPKSNLMILKYYDPRVSGSNNLRSTIQAIKYAIRMHAQIINYSGGGVEYSQEEHDAVEEAGKKGILFVAAAGNEKSNSDERGKHYYPADYGLANIISVTAVNKEDTAVLASSNYGTHTVDLAAPGEGIKSTLPGGSLGYMTGTSQATAFVTAVAELVMSHNHDFNYAEVKKYILRTGDEYPTLQSKTGTAKLLNSYKALVSLDMGLSTTGVKVSNTAGMGTRTFASDQNLKDPKLNTGALNAGAEGNQEPAEAIAMFGREFVKALQNKDTSSEGARTVQQ
jgi:thermitase